MFKIFHAYLQVIYNRAISNLTMIALGIFDRINSYLRANIEYSPNTDSLPMIESVLFASINGNDCTSSVNHLLYESWKDTNYFTLSEIREKLCVSSTDDLLLVTKVLLESNALNNFAGTPVSEIHTIRINGNKWTIDGISGSVPSFGIISNAFN